MTTHLPILRHQHLALLGQATSQCAPYAAVAQCKKGCAACCHQHTLCSPLEVILMAHAIRVHARAAELWRRVAVQAERVRQSLSYADRHDQRVACPLLDEETRTCAAYGARPTACRQVLVMSDPAKCAPPAQDVAWILEVMQLMGQVRLHLQGEMEQQVLAGFGPEWPVFGYEVAGFAERALSGRFRLPARPFPLVWGLTGPRRGKPAGSGLAERRLVFAAPSGHFAHHSAAHELRDRFADVKHGPDGADVVAGEVDGDAARGAPLGQERRQLGEGGRRGTALPILAREVVDALVAVIPDDAPVEPPPQREVDGLVVYPKKSFWHSALQLRRVVTHSTELGSGEVGASPSPVMRGSRQWEFGGYMGAYHGGLT